MEFNMQEEDRDGNIVSVELKKIWKTELDLLSALLDVCKRHNLQCWLDGGSLLGAVRHHGFIPWDDDIDVCMMREDYDKLLQIGPKEFKSPMFLQSAYTDIDYYRGHVQLRNSDTAAIRPSDSYQPFNQGIFVDIFPFDGYEPDDGKRKAMIKQKDRILKLLKAKNTAILASGRLGLVFRKIKSRYLVKRYGWTTIYKQAEDVARSMKIKDSDKVAQMLFSGDQIVFDKDIFNETIWMDFENIKVPVPVGYDKFLRTQYGDNYMTPIKEGNNHGTVVFDTEHSYKEVLPKVRSEYRKSALRRLKKKIMK
jgi:lipopolysaccharide cholinephosphotransferase